jgi:rhodanese-related sulfurtransferase
MRKLVAGLGLALLLAAPLSCGASPAEAETSPPNPSPSPDVPPPPPKAEYKKITPRQAQGMIIDGAVILDVRTQEEFEGGHIEGAVLLPGGEVGERAKEVLPDKNQTILVYCRSGRRSELAARELISMGYTNVYDFGGIIDWPGEIVK